MKIMENEAAGRGFTLVELLIVIMILGILMAMVVGVAMRAPEDAYMLNCINNLKEIHKMCILYESEHNSFPYAGEEATACEHFQVLADFDPDNFKPRMLICKAMAGDEPAEEDEDEDGGVTLTEENVSYAWAKNRRSLSSKGRLLLSADKHGGEDIGHYGGDKMNILRADGDVKKIDFTKGKDKGKTWDEVTKGQLVR